ncbi:MAG TPA: glycosyltransferase, partial [Ottowia sp.]|nr:glycosyltransferase [Ottowia sp.]
LAAGAVGAVSRLLEEGFDFDVIDAHYYYPDGVAAALLAAHFGKPLAVTARGTDVNLIPEHALPRRWLRWASTRAAASIGVSQALVERMRALSFDPARLHVLRNGVDLERFQPQPAAQAREALGIRGAPVLLTVGNLHEHKGQHLAIDALALLRARFPGACLLVVGTGPDDKALRAQAERAALGEDAVRFVGAVPNAQLARWYSAADVLLLCSSREGWPNVLLEAMACGTPVVASAVGGVGEIVSSPVAGRMVVERSAPAFASAVADLLARPVDRGGVRAHAEQFGWDGTSRGQVALFEAIRAQVPA